MVVALLMDGRGAWRRVEDVDIVKDWEGIKSEEAAGTSKFQETRR